MPIGKGRFGCRRDDAGLILPSVGFSVPTGIAHVRPFLTAPLIFPSPQSLLTCLSLIFQRLAASFVLIILCITIPHIHFYRYSIAHYRNNVKNNIRNNVRNYTAAFLDIVPIEKGQAILPALWVQHLIKRCKYEFLPHATSALRSSCLTRQSFCAVPTEFENRFLCLLHLSLCVVK